MAKITGYWGIDIGQCALKALRLELVDGKPIATAFDYIEHPKILSQPDADPDALTREALEKFLSRNPVKHDTVAISVAGQSGLARFVKLPPVEEKKISDIVKFEAKQQIPFPLEEVVWDFQKVGGGENIGGFAMETEIGLFAMKRDIINRHLGHYQSVKAEVHIVQMAPLALCNYATYEILKRGGVDGIDPTAAPETNDDTPRGKKRCAVILDIGTENSNLIITDGGKIIWQRPVPLGGNNFTRALTKELKLTFAKAEHLKRNAAKSPELAQILKALRPVLTDFVGEVQRSLGYFTNTHRDAHVAYLVGLGSAFKLPGLQKYLSEKLALEVRKPSKMERLSGDQVLNDPNFTDNILTFPVAYGLALQATGLGRLQTNLLPSEIRTDRLIRAKKPWAAAAAAALLLGTGAVAFGYGTQYQAVSDKRIATAIGKAESAVKAAKTQEGERTKKEGERTAAIGDVKAIVSGNDERLNWTRVLELISASLPVPGVLEKGTDKEIVKGNLDLPDQLPYWKTAKQQLAIAKHYDRIASGVPLTKLYDDDKSEDLPTVNIEAVDCRYSDNVQTFLTNAQAWADKISGLPILLDFPPGAEKIPVEDATSKFKETPKAPEGPAWIIEIRGYTYNRDATNFLRKCLVGNLKRSEHFAKVTDPTEKKVATSLQAEALPDPVKGRISHAFLALSHAKDPKREAVASGAGASSFQYIPSSQLDFLLAPKAAPAATGGNTDGGSSANGPPPNIGGPNLGVGEGQNAAAAKWVGILGKSANNANFFSGEGSPGGAFPGGSGLGPPMGTPGFPAPAPQPGAQPAVAGPKTKYPTEFIVYMIWREPSTDAAPAPVTK